MNDSSAAQPAGQAIPFDQLSSMVDTLLASPEFQKSARFDDFLVSPSLSPCDDFNMSPSIDDSPLTPNLDTPIMNDLSDDFGMFSEYSGIPLFNDGAMTMYQLLETPEIAQEALTEMYELPVPKHAPSVDAINPTSLDLSSPTAASPSPASTKFGKVTAASRRKSTATGTRKNITPDLLVPVDAPIQGRNYATPSATSRKEVPAAFLKSQKRKRSRVQAFGDEESLPAESLPSADADVEEQPPLNATEKEIIEWKRRQNTLAARKSRKRKLEHQQFLETRVKDLESENEMLKVRADALEAALRAHNIFLPATNA